MVTYTWAPPGPGEFVNWNTPADWSPNGVPNSPAADVVIPVITQSDGFPYESYVTVESNESYVVNALTLDQDLEVQGTLEIAAGLTLGATGAIDLTGTLTMGAISGAGGIQGSGLISSVTSIDNHAGINGSGLTIEAPSFQNDGALQASYTTLDVDIAMGGAFTNLSDGVLTGGAYGADMGGILLIGVADVITTDAADIELSGYGSGSSAIETDGGAGGEPIGLEQTLQTVAPVGTLSIGFTSFAPTHPLFDAGLIQVLSGTLSTTSLTIASSGTLSASGAIEGPIVDDGQIIVPEVSLTNGVVEPDADLVIGGPVTGTGTISLAGGPNPIFIENGVTAVNTVELAGLTSAAVSFTGFNGILQIDQPTTFTGAIEGFTTGNNYSRGLSQLMPTPASDEIAIPGIALNAVTSVSYSGSDTAGTLDIATATGTIALNFVGDYTTSDFVVAAGPQVLSSSPPSIEITEVQPCFASGTRLMTDRGPVAVENLAVGDRVRSARDGGSATIRWIGHRRVDCARHPRPWDVWPVRIAAHALAPGRPHNPLWLSPDHAVLSNGVLIPIRCLINGATIVQQPRDAVTYWHVELPRHDIVLAEGLPAESFLDTGNRGAFSNGGVPLHLHADFALRVWEADACAPLVREGPALAAAKRGLLARAKALGHRQTGDAALHLVVDDEPTRARVAGTVHRFWVRRGARDVRLVSRRGVPADVHADSADHRRLGVAVARIEFAGEPIALNDPRLHGGWHPSEQSAEGVAWRWTDGEAALSLAGEGILSVDVLMTEQYWLDEPAAVRVQSIASSRPQSQAPPASARRFSRSVRPSY